MIVLIALLPWVLAVAALLFILNKKNNDDDEEFEDDFISEEHPDVIRVAVFKDKAYWVYENIFYQSEITWEPDFTTAQPIDTMSLSQKEVVDLMQVLDELKEQEQG